MAMKKRYHTVNGMMIGETSNGVRRGYLPDALGSVVATVDDNGAIENTYRYKPYGSLLAKTGTGDDPRFMWVGSRGYRADHGINGPPYLRTRHYDPSAAQFLAADTFFRMTDPYVYCNSRPATLVDPFGMFGYTVVSGPKPQGQCGGAIFDIHWNIEQLPLVFIGVVVQHIRSFAFVKDCNGRPTPSNNAIVEFWEAWLIKGGKVFVGSPPYELGTVHDRFQTVNEPSCTFGFIKYVGKVKLIEGPIPFGFIAGTVTYANDAYSTYGPVLWWSDVGAIDHRLEVDYGCCCSLTFVGPCPSFPDCPQGPYLCPPSVRGH